MVMGTPTESTVTQLISRDQAEEWAGVRLTDEQLERLAAAIPNSSIPDAIATIVVDALEIGDDDAACRDPFNEDCREPLDDGQGWAGCCGGCADRMERLHNEHDWGDNCQPSNDGQRCITCD